MSTKQQKRKAAKATARIKRVKAAAMKERVDIAKAASAKQDKALRYSLATEGLIKTAQALAKDKKQGASKTVKTMTNIEALKIINESIPVLSGIHAAIEVADRLHKEGKIDQEIHQVEMVEEMDKLITLISEDVHALFELINAGRQPEDYADVFIHYVDLTASVFEFNIPQIMSLYLKPLEAQIDEYVVEHKLPEEDNLRYTLRAHEERLQRVAPLYRTKLEPVSESVVDPEAQAAADEAKLTNDPLSC